jgi:hypothetical protein
LATVARKPTRASAAKPARAAAVKRPPEIPAAKWKAYSPSYKRRMAGFYKAHPGAPQYRARGKQAGESLTRRQRLEARIAALAERQSYRGQRYGSRDAEDIAESFRALIRGEGERAFGDLERAIAARRKGDGRIDTADMFGWEWADYDGEASELFYN